MKIMLDVLRNWAEKNAGDTHVVSYMDVLLAVVSLLVLIVTILLSRRDGAFGPTRGRKYNWTTIMVGMFIAAVLFSVGYALEETGYLMNSFFYAMQMMISNRDVPSLMQSDDMSSFLFGFYRLYTVVLFLVSPAATVAAIGSYLSQFLSTPLIWARSRKQETYIFSNLTNRALTLAKSVQQHYQERGESVSLVFAHVSVDVEESLQYEAKSMGALCIDRGVSTLWQYLKESHRAYIILDSEDEVRDITLAASMRTAIDKASKKRRLPPIEIYAIASLTSAEALIGVGEQGRGAAGNQKLSETRVCRIDWTRSLVERALDRYPLFLHGLEPVDGTCGIVSLKDLPHRYLAWEKEMYERPDRHVLIIGGGHVGIEFFRLALSYAEIGSSPSDAPMHFRFDVFDDVEDPAASGRCQAELRFKAQAPQALEGVDCTFHLADALGQELFDFVSTHADTITYVFIALGDDLMSAQVAMQVRSTLERALVRICTKRASQEGPSYDARRAYASATRPAIVVVVEDDELSVALSEAEEDGLAYRIDTIGSDSHLYSYDSIFLGDYADTEYERRSTRAAQGHSKYRLFAYARSQAATCTNMGELAVSWRADFDSDARGSLDEQTRAAIDLYEDYLKKTKPTGDGVDSHEWLLEMEHNRWVRYLRADGFVAATPEEVETFFAVGQPKQRHRLNIARLHPCLVPFHELSTIDAPIDRLYEQCETRCESCAFAPHCRKSKKTTPFQVQNDDYIGI